MFLRGSHGLHLRGGAAAAHARSSPTAPRAQRQQHVIWGNTIASSLRQWFSTGSLIHNIQTPDFSCLFKGAPSCSFFPPHRFPHNFEVRPWRESHHGSDGTGSLCSRRFPRWVSETFEEIATQRFSFRWLERYHLSGMFSKLGALQIFGFVGFPTQNVDSRKRTWVAGKSPFYNGRYIFK